MKKTINVCVNGKKNSSVQISLDEATVIENVDKTIIAVSEKIQKNEILPDKYADTVKALATLVEARAELI